MKPNIITCQSLVGKGYMIIVVFGRSQSVCLLAFLFILTLNLKTNAQNIIDSIKQPGLSPTGIAVYEAGNKIFVADTSDVVFMYDGITSNLIDTIHTGIKGINQMSVVEKYGKIYATTFDINNGKIAVIDAISGNMVRHIIPNVFQNWFLQIDKDEELGVIYAGCIGGFFRIDAQTDSIKKMGSFSTSLLGTFEVNPVTHEIYLKRTMGTTVAIIDPHTFNQITEFGGYGDGIGINWKENKAYIAYTGGGPSVIYNRNTGQIKNTITYNDALVLEYNSTGNRMYSSSEIDQWITVIDGKTDFDFNINFGRGASNPYICYATNHVFYSGNPLIIIDDSTMSSKTINASGNNIAINQQTQKVYVAKNGMIQVIADSTDPWPLIQPVLLSPGSGETGVLLKDTLRWSKVPGAISYYLELSRFENSFLSSDIKQVGIIDTFFCLNISTYFSNTKYYWRVRAENANVKSNFSTTGKFTTIVGPPILTYPYWNWDVPVNPTFTWQAASGATSYRIQLSDKRDFSHLLIDQAGISTTSYSVKDLDYSTEYYWRVNSTDGKDTSAFSNEPFFNTATSPYSLPILFSPADQSFYNPLSPVLKWKSYTSATYYKLQVANVYDFSHLIVDLKNLTDTAFQVSGLENNKNYYWRVNVRLDSVFSGWSYYWNFYTIPAIPNIPTLITPANGSTNQPLNLYLSWTPGESGESYTVQVSTDSGFNNLILNESSISATTKWIFGLIKGKTYFWRVKATNFSGSSNWSGYWSFSTILAEPDIPTLSSPINGATNQPLATTLNWNTSNGATSYSLQVSPASDFSTIVFSDTNIVATTLQVYNLDYSTKYYWRVNAKNFTGSSAWSEVRNFTTMKALAIPTLSSPAHDSINQPLNLSLQWNPVQGAQTYALQVSDTSNFSTLAVNQTGLTSTSFSPAGLTGGKKYYWRVEAISPTDTSGWSSVWNFTTIFNIPAVPNLNTPANNASIPPGSITLTWNPSTGAATYNVQVSPASDFSVSVLNQTGMTTRSLLLSGLPAGMTFYWRVSATNSNGTSGWSETWNFTTISGATTPMNQASNIIVSDITGNSSKIKWTKGSGTRSIVFIKQGTDGIPEPVDNFSYTANANFRLGSQVESSGWYCVYLGTDSTVTVNKLDGQTTYRTMVISLNGIEGEEKYLKQTASGNPVTFSTVCDPDFYGILPDVHLYVINPSIFDVEITNTHSCGTTTLKFLNIALSNRTFNITVNAYPNTGNLQGTMSADGNSFSGTYNINYKYLHPLYGYPVSCSTKSGSWSATRKSQGPMIPLLNYPENNFVNLSISQVLKWNPSAGALSYSVQVSKSDGFNPILFSGNNITVTEYSLPGLEFNSKYYWRVSSINDCYTTNWSDSWSFTTATGVGIPYIFDKDFIWIYPNPASEKITVEFEFLPPRNADLEVSDLLGRTMFFKKLQGLKSDIDISTLPVGIYVARIKIGESIFNKKITIQ